MLKGKTKNLDIVLYIQRGIMNDIFIKKYLKDDQIDEMFTIIRSRNQLNFMLGCLYANSNKMVYASEYKHSVPEDLYNLMNGDVKNEVKVLKHINIKEFMKLRDKKKYLKILQRNASQVIDLDKEDYVSKPIQGKNNSNFTHYNFCIEYFENR